MNCGTLRNRLRSRAATVLRSLALVVLAAVLTSFASAEEATAAREQDAAMLGPENEVLHWEQRLKEVDTGIARAEQMRKDARSGLLEHAGTVDRLRKTATESDEEVRALYQEIQKLKRRVKELEAEYEGKLTEVPGVSAGVEARNSGIVRARELDKEWRELYRDKREVWQKLQEAKRRAAEEQKRAEASGTK